jgi:hypothetical protein
MHWLTEDTTLGRCKPTWGIATSSTPCAILSYLRLGLRISGEANEVGQHVKCSLSLKTGRLFEMVKVHTTRTYAPLQFEALEPHRFEDLVRDLIYDFRDWQTIEATGRSGSDQGYDIRAFEKVSATVRLDEEAEQEDISLLPEGNRWMIQCKREKELGPTRVQNIIEGSVDKNDPPYGYILAAPANFSKRSYDAFRSTLVERGVQEFHLLGRAELEDLLYMPKNDRILFAFFGISLVSKKRTRVTEIRTTVNNKNKLYSIFEAQVQDQALFAPVLIRDVNDRHYPNKDNYPDFDKRPHFYPEGIRFNIREHFAYINRKTKEWDFTPVVDLVPRRIGNEDDREETFELRENVKHFWEHLPQAHQAKHVRDGIVLYQNFQFIDKQGDALYKFPHLFVDFANKGPFDAGWEHLKYGHDEWCSIDDYKRIEVFPKEFRKGLFGKIYKDRSISLPPYLVGRLKRIDTAVVFDWNDAYDFLSPNDVINVAGTDDGDTKLFLELTHRYTIKLRDLYEDQSHMKWEVEQQARKELDPELTVTALEVKRVYEHALKV